MPFPPSPSASTHSDLSLAVADAKKASQKDHMQSIREQPAFLVVVFSKYMDLS